MKILRKLNIGETIIANHEFILNRNDVMIDQIWLYKASKLLYLEDFSDQYVFFSEHYSTPLDIHNAKEYKTQLFRWCLEFYTSEVISRKLTTTPATNDLLLKTINYEGFHIFSLNIDLGVKKDSKINQDLWIKIFSKLPNLKRLSISSNEVGSNMGPLLHGALHHCLSLITINIRLLGSNKFHAENFEKLGPLCVIPIADSISTDISRSILHLRTETQFGVHGNYRNKQLIKDKIKHLNPRKPCPISLAFVPSYETPNPFNIIDLYEANSNQAFNITTFITTLNLSNLNLGYEGCQLLCSSFTKLGKSLSLVHLILANTNITAKGIIEITESLINVSSEGQISKNSCSNNIKTLNFDSIIDSHDLHINDCFKYFGSMLCSKVFNNLSNLNLSNNSCTYIGINALLDGIEKTTNLTTLSLCSTTQLGTYLSRLAQVLNKNQSISNLLISNCKFLPRQLILFFGQLQKTKLTMLDISRNTFDLDSTAALLDWMEQRSKLENLIIEGSNERGDIEWKKLLLSGITNIKSLNSINLKSQGLDDSICEIICNQWMKKKILNVTFWNLKNNYITNKGLGYLLSGRKFIPKKFITVQLNDNHISDKMLIKREYSGFLFLY